MGCNHTDLNRWEGMNGKEGGERMGKRMDEGRESKGVRVIKINCVFGIRSCSAACGISIALLSQMYS